MLPNLQWLCSCDKSAGRRGLSGTLFLFKILGAMADRGTGLEELAAAGREVVASMGTMGLALGPCRYSNAFLQCLNRS